VRTVAFPLTHGGRAPADHEPFDVARERADPGPAAGHLAEMTRLSPADGNMHRVDNRAGILGTGGTRSACPWPSRSGGVELARRRVRLGVALALAVWIALPASSAAAFGTIDSGGQHREHERITRAALACAADPGPGDGCFEPASMDFLAGHDREFGGVGAPDSDEIFVPAAHCDNADFLEVGYPRTRLQATAGLVDCVDHLRDRFAEAVDGAEALLDVEGRVVEEEVDLDVECRVFEAAEGRARCGVLEAFGRVLHGVQDFYAHSNWADEYDPARAIGADNPPGMNLPGPSPVLDLRSDASPIVPPELMTGCFVVRDEVPGIGECTGRVTHAALNKDTGLVDPVTGDTTDPDTPRGMVEDNFAKAVAGAIAETRRQWQDFRSELTSRYGEHEGPLMACALTHDDPMNDCRESRRVWVLVGVLALGVVVPTVFMLLFRARRSSRP
jgi:hypothetical protein